MDLSKYKGMFLSETREHLANMARLAVALEQDPADREGINAMFREAHSIKGMAASMGYQQTAELAHHLEDMMDGFRKTGSITTAAIDRLLAGVDLIEKLTEDLAADRPERTVADYLAAAATAPAEPASAFAVETPTVTPAPEAALKVTVELAAGAAAPAARAFLILRELAAVGEVLHSAPAQQELLQGGEVRRLDVWLRSEEAPTELARMLGAMPDVARVTFAGDRRQARPQPEEGGRSVRVSTDLLDRFIDLTGELLTHRDLLQTAFQAGRREDLGAALEQLSRYVRDLHHHVLKVRMMPLESITGQLPRTVRDLARKAGKEIRLTVCGEKVELDRAILEVLGDPLLHLVRNAVDHGIVREGEVRIRAWREKDQVLIEVADDGRGIDPQVLRQKALEKGFITGDQAEALADHDALQLVCCPGLSTAPAVTETSGRGVGMDVVKATVTELGGSLEIASAPGAGSRFLFRLPLSVAIVQSLLLELEGRLLGIPISRVLRALEVPREELAARGRQLVLTLPKPAIDDEEGEPTTEEVPLLSLRKVLGLPGRALHGQIPAVVLESRGRKVGLVVDRFAGKREVFVKALAAPLGGIQGISGGAVLGDGRIVFILDPQTLLEAPHPKSREEEATRKPR